MAAAMALEHPMSTRWTQEQVDEIVAKWDRDHRKMKRLPAWATPSQPTAPLTQLKRSKYGNTKVTDEQGKVHDSNKEYRRWCDLQLLERGGKISNLRHHVVFDLAVNGKLVCKYEADASYVDNATGKKVVEDTKPDDPKFRKTLAYRHFRLKAKLFEAIHGYDISEV